MVTKIGTWRVAGSAVGLTRSMRPSKRSFGIAADLERDRPADLDGGDLLGRHRRLEPHARRIDDGVELAAGADDVAGVDVPLRHDARDRRLDGHVLERLAHRGDPRPRVVGGRLGLRRGVARHLGVALGERAALDQVLDARRFLLRPFGGLLGRAQLRLRRRVARRAPAAPRCAPAASRPRRTRLRAGTPGAPSRQFRRAPWPRARPSAHPR